MRMEHLQRAIRDRGFWAVVLIAGLFLSWLLFTDTRKREGDRLMKLLIAPLFLEGTSRPESFLRFRRSDKINHLPVVPSIAGARCDRILHTQKGSRRTLA